MEQSPLPFRKRSLQGGISALYGSNGRRYVATGQLEGAFPGDFAWRLQGTWSNSGDRSTAHYLLNNTGTREYHASASLGYDRGRLRVEGFYSRFYSRTGVMLSAQMGSEDLLAERIRLGRPLPHGSLLPWYQASLPGGHPSDRIRQDAARHEEGGEYSLAEYLAEGR